MWLKQSIVQVIPFGPCLDKGNGVDLEIGLLAALDHAATGIMLSKNGGTLAVREQGANFVASTYDAHGCYKVSLSAIDTGTLGRLRVIYTDPTTNLPVWQDCKVIPAQVWDSLFGADKLDVNVAERANLDFGALEKLSLNAATPASVQALTQGATAGELAAAVTALAVEGNVQGHVADALTAYDPPTRTEATADKAELSALIAKVRGVLSNRLVVDSTTGAFTIYADDGVTVLVTGTISETGRGVPTWV